MLSRRDVLKTAVVGTPLLLGSGSARLEGQDAVIPPSPPTTAFARPLRIPRPPTKLNRPDASPQEMALAWEIYYEAAAPESGKAPGECHCVNDAVAVWPRLIPEQDAEAFKPTGDVDYYQIVMEEVSGVEVLQGLSTTIWTYFDHPFDVNAPLAPWVVREAPGPTIVAERGRPVIVRFVNRLRVDSPLARPGEPPDTCVHGHGCHTPPQSDGYPTDCIPAWTGSGRPHTRVYVHPNDNDFPGTLWYHDHTNHHTGRNTYYGQSAYYILKPHPTAEGRDAFFRTIDTCLPTGDCDVPLVFQDRLFHADGSLNHPDFNHDGILGDTFLVNGRVQPYLAVEPRKYRFRWLNGSSARFYALAFSRDPQRATRRFNFVQVGSEGGLLPRPAVRSIAEIAMAERHEIVFDFAEVKRQGLNRVYLVNAMEQDDGRGPDEIEVDRCTPLVRFDIGNTITGGVDSSFIPAILNPELVRDANGDWAYPGYSEKDVPLGATGKPRERVFRFDRRHGMWTINGEIFGAHRNDAVGGVKLSKEFPVPDQVCMVANPVPPLDASTVASFPPPGPTTRGTHPPEIWRVVNDSGGWMHPIHIHMEQFKILSREDSDTGQRFPLRAHEVGLKDTFVLHENETIRVIATFKDHNDHFDNQPGVLQDYVFHCHNIEHEDMDMMATKRLYTGSTPPPDPPSGCEPGEN